MAEDQKPQGTGKPTLKMLEFAKSIAEKIGVRLSDEIMADFEVCSKFIEENKEKALRPSEKQVNYANSIASNKGLTIPEEALANGKELSKWIDSHK